MSNREVKIVQFEPKTIYSIRRRVDGDDNKIGELYNDKENDFNASGLERVDGFFTLFHEADKDMEVGAVISSDTVIGGRNRRLDLGLCCCATVYGSYDSLATCYETLDKWMTNNKYTLNGPIMEHYTKAPEDGIPESDFVTVVYYPIKM